MFFLRIDLPACGMPLALDSDNSTWNDPGRDFLFLFHTMPRRIIFAEGKLVMSYHSATFFARLTLSLWMGVGSLFCSGTAGFAAEESPNTTSSHQEPALPSVPSPPPAHPRAAIPSIDEKGQQDLKALRKKPEEFRTLVTGVQIFLGRFGYGVGPYSGVLDQQTKDALKAYQQHSGLSPTGDIDFPTLKRLTEDDRLMNRVVPFLPQQAVHDQEWGQRVDVQGSWMLKEGNTDDILQTSNITCMRELNRCIDSTAYLINSNVPQLKVHTYIYDIKDWDDSAIVSEPYDGEACAVSVLRISRNPPRATRFVSLHHTPGSCEKVKTGDRQYVLEDGRRIYQILRMQKSEAIQQILQISE